MIYLISASSLREAHLIAEERKIPRQDIRYIPSDNVERRDRAMRGLSIDSDEQFIGYFSNEEKMKLSRGKIDYIIDPITGFMRLKSPLDV